MPDQTFAATRSSLSTANYLDKVQRNPSETAQAVLRGLTADPQLQISQDGDIIAYKGLTAAGLSTHAGIAYVNGVKITGQIPNPVGATVLMPRDRVNPHHDGTCSFGLHAGPYDYADKHSEGMVVEVSIDPADVVSAPEGESFEEVRVCRYTVLSSTVIPDRFGAYLPDDEPLPPEPNWDEPDYDEGDPDVHA